MCSIPAVSDLLVRLSHLSRLQALLLHRHQLPQDGAGTDHVDEPTQEELGGRPHPQVKLLVKNLFSLMTFHNFRPAGTTSTTAT